VGLVDAFVGQLVDWAERGDPAFAVRRLERRMVLFGLNDGVLELVAAFMGEFLEDFAYDGDLRPAAATTS